MLRRAGRVKLMLQSQTSRAPVKSFGEEHWSLLAYIDCCCSGNAGRVEHRHMRRSPAKSGLSRSVTDYLYQSDVEKDGYDDWDFLADLEAAGFVQLVCYATGLVHIFPAGIKAAEALRQHGARGQSIKNFRYL